MSHTSGPAIGIIINDRERSIHSPESLLPETARFPGGSFHLRNGTVCDSGAHDRWATAAMTATADRAGRLIVGNRRRHALGDALAREADLLV
jgi:hypothetical protein